MFFPCRLLEQKSSQTSPVGLSLLPRTLLPISSPLPRLRKAEEAQKDSPPGKDFFFFFKCTSNNYWLEDPPAAILKSREEGKKRRRKKRLGIFFFALKKEGEGRGKEREILPSSWLVWRRCWWWSKGESGPRAKLSSLPGLQSGGRFPLQVAKERRGREKSQVSGGPASFFSGWPAGWLAGSAYSLAGAR